MGRQTKMKYSDGAEALTFYDSKGRMERSEDPDGVTMLYAYNDQGERDVQAIDLDNNDTIDWDTDRITRTDDFFTQRGSVHVRRRETRVWSSDSDTTAGDGTVIRIQDQAVIGDESWSESFGQVSSQALIDSTTSDGDWKKVTTNPDGSQTELVYTDGRLTSTRQLDAGSNQITQTTYAYDSLGRRYTVTDARTGTTTYAYYLNDAVASVTEPEPSATEPLGTLKTEYVYDSMGRVIETILPDNSVTYRVYNLRGQVTKQYGSQTYPVEYAYDDRGRRTEMTTWQDFNESTGVGVSGDATTTWVYDAYRGWLERKQYDDGNGVDYTYTDGGRLASRTWARGVVTNYAYSLAGDLLAVDYSDSTPDVAYAYKRNGRKDAVTDGTFGSSPFAAGDILASAPALDTTRYMHEYDYNGRLQLKTETVSGLLTHDVILTRTFEDGTETYGLDGRSSGYELGHPEYVDDSTQLTIPADADAYGIATYSYDAAGRLLEVADGTDEFTYGYTSNSNLLATMTGPVHTVTYSYEPGRNAVKNIENEDTVGTDSVVSNYAYTMNALGQRASRQQSGSAISDGTDAFFYDSLGQIDYVDYSDDTGTDPFNRNNDPDWNPSYSFDMIGNRSGNTVDANGTTDYQPDLLNQYDSVGGVLWDDPNDLSKGYDPDGNFIGDGVWSFTWDGENRLINATNGTADIDYEYDYRSRLIKRYDQTDVEVYAYDGWNRIGKFVNGSPDTAYLWGMDLSGSIQGAGGVGGLLKEGSVYPLYDANGNIMQKLNVSGTTDMKVEYDPFGNVINGSLVGEYGFSTKPLDADTQMLYYGYRWYDPVTGRWPSRDPIGERGGLNLYAISINNSVNLMDVLGLAPSVEIEETDPNHFTIEAWGAGTGNTPQYDQDSNIITELLPFDSFDQTTRAQSWGGGTRSHTELSLFNGVQINGSMNGYTNWQSALGAYGSVTYLQLSDDRSFDVYVDPGGSTGIIIVVYEVEITSAGGSSSGPGLDVQGANLFEAKIRSAGNPDSKNFGDLLRAYGTVSPFSISEKGLNRGVACFKSLSSRSKVGWAQMGLDWYQYGGGLVQIDTNVEFKFRAY